jgi:hypothetical protein
MAASFAHSGLLLVAQLPALPVDENNAFLATPEVPAVASPAASAPLALSAVRAPMRSFSTLARVAMAVQIGRAEEVTWWRALFSHMRCAADVDLFVFLWRNDAAAEASLAAWADADNSSLVHFSTPSSRDAIGSPFNCSQPRATWTEGRNELARAIYAQEVARARQYAAWAMLDGDRARMTCQHSSCFSAARPLEARAWFDSACCIENVLAPALSYNFATVASTPSFPSAVQTFPAAAAGQQDAREWAFYFNSMADAQFQVFHRDAVPVLLPYFSGFDAQSWWLSQYALFFFASG